jgi:tetratricopeptide (TPR) repeat protein
MYRVLALVLVIIGFAAVPARAASPDDQYVAILYLIQQGDAAESAGSRSEAFARFTSAFTELQQLQHDAPGWESDMVSYRLNYLRKRLDVLGAARPLVAPASQPAAPARNAAPDPVLVLQAQLQQSQADIALLQAKLREALAARPASLDPAQLAAAEEHVRQLSKENELLKVSSSAAGAGSNAAGAATAAALAAENELLKRQMAGLKSASSPGEPKGSATGAGALASESARPGDEKRIKQLVQERDALQRQVAVYESKAVPYTAEELALLRLTPPGLLAGGKVARKASAPPKPPPGTAGLIADAQRYYARGDFARAEECYQQVLRKDTRNVYTLANLASIQIEAGKLDEAERNLNQALAIAPDDVYSLQLLGSLKFRQNNLDAAMDALTRAASMDPNNPEILNILGVTLNHKGQRAAAENALRRAITIDPGYANAHNNLAVIYASQDPPCIELARMHYQRALSSGYPRNPELEKMLDQKKTAVAGTASP